MNFGDHGEKLEDMRAEQKWEYINLSDFKSTSCFTPLSYGFLYIFSFTSVIVYGVDIFTAINLLVFDRWSGQVKPIIPFHISRWIFAGCIMLTWIFLIFRWARAFRAIRSGGIAASYLDPLAVRVQSIRIGAGQGWRRWLVFAELTKSRKGTEYVALFTYFSFEAWMRIVFAEGPRQVINALTLYSVMRVRLLPNGPHAEGRGHTPVVQFFVNLQLLADGNREQAAILFSMLFTFIIWTISIINLAIAVMMYLMFLWHHIPSGSGGLSGYCTRKINARLRKIVGAKYKRALAKENAQRVKEDAEAMKAGEPASVQRKPTIPVLEDWVDNKLVEMPMLSRQTTMSTLPLYTSRPPTQDADSLLGFQRKPTLPDLSLVGLQGVPPARTLTQSSDIQDMSQFADNEVAYVEPGRVYTPVGFSKKRSDISMSNSRPRLNSIDHGSSEGTPSTSAVSLLHNSDISRNQYFAWGDPASATDRDEVVHGHEMWSRPATNGLERSIRQADGSKCQAFRPVNYSSPATTTSRTTYQPNPRNTSVPIQVVGHDRDYSCTRLLPQRSCTAPLPQLEALDTHIYDTHKVYRYHQPRPKMPTRAATVMNEDLQYGAHA